MRVLPTLCLTGSLVVGLPAAALAHAELVPWQLPPGETAGLLLLVTHGCGDEDEWISTEPMPEEPTTAVTVQVPLELAVEPVPVEGWSLSTERDEEGEPTSATWRSEDPAGTLETLQLPIDVTTADGLADGSHVWLPVVQECTGGESLSWTLEGEVRGGDEIPALRLFIDADATAPQPWAGRDPDGAEAPAGGRSPRLGLASATLVALGVGGLAIALRRRRRSDRGDQVAT